MQAQDLQGSVGSFANGQQQQQPKQGVFAVSAASADGREQQQRQVQEKGGKPRKDRAPYWEQLRVLLQRTARVRRFEQMTGQHFFQLSAVAFITGGCVLADRWVGQDGGMEAQTHADPAAACRLLCWLLAAASLVQAFCSRTVA